jgi:hypothetical protein
MSIQVKPLDNEPIIVMHIMPPSEIPGDVLGTIKACADFKRAKGGHVYKILDFTTLGEDLPFANLVNGMVFETKVEGGINDMDVSTIYVGSTEWVLFGAAAFKNQKQYGETNVVHICGTVEEAITFARNDITSKKQK